MKKFLLSILITVALFNSSKAQNWTWAATNGPYGSNVNDIAVTSTGVFLAATNSGLFRSTDSGATWTKVTVSSNQNIGYADLEITSTGTIIVALTNLSPSFPLFSSSDNGLTWTSLAGSGLVSGSVKRIKSSPNGKLFVAYANTTSSNLYVSSDNGATFAQPFAALPSTNINDIDTDSGNRLIVSTSSAGIQVSGSALTSFLQGTGITGTNISATTVDASGNLYALASDAPYRSIDHGATWTTIKGTISDVSFFGFIETDPSNNLYIVNNSTNKIYTSTNPATTATWTAGANLNLSNSNTVYSVNFQSPTAWYLGRYGTGIDKSTDAGASWSSLSTGIKGRFNPRLFMTSNGRLFYAFGGTGFQLSIDNGATWNLIATGNANRNLYGFIKLSDGSVLGYGFSGVIRSTDNGSNWTQQTGSATYNLSTADGINLYTSNGNVVSKSTDQGVTWNPITLTGFPGGPYSISKIVPDTGGNVYFVLLNQSIFNYELWKLPNLSSTIAKVTAFPASGFFLDVQTVGTNLYAAAQTTLYKSTDGGTSFSTNTFTGSANNLWAVDDSNLYLQTSSGFQATTNGGASWTTKTLVDNLATATDLLITSSQYLFVATNNSVVQKSSIPVILPPAPTNLAITSRTIQGVDLIWSDNATNETGYQLEVSIGNNTSYALSNTFTGNFVSPVNKILIQGIRADSVLTYYYRVRTVNLAGYSGYSNEVSGLGLKSCTSKIPDNRSWTAVTTVDAGSTASGPGPFTSSSIAVQKIANTKSDYTVSLYALGIVPAGIHGASTNAFFTEACGQTYFQSDASLLADLANGLGVWNGSNTITLKWQADPSSYTNFQATTTLTLNSTDPIPAAPTLAGYIFSGTQNLLIWNAVPFATQYIIERSIGSSSFSGLPFATVNFPVVQYSDASGIIAGTTYFYRISAKNSFGTSTPSAQVSITPPTSTMFTPVANSLAVNSDNQQGVSWADLDGDGDEDYISPSFTNYLGTLTIPTFYENTGSGQFTRRSIDVMQGEASTYRGAVVADVNNDGKPDVYFTKSDASLKGDILLINNGAWSFTKQFISQTGLTASSFQAASMADFDRDGLIDLYVGGTDGTGSGLTPSFLKNTSAGGAVTYAQLTGAGSLYASSINRELSWADFNNDGLQDLLVLSYNASALNPNPNQANKLFRNNGDGTFSAGVGNGIDSDIFFGARTASWGDIDNDGDLDLYIGSQTASVTDRLYRNNNNGTFTSIANAVAEAGTLTFGSAFGDIDNDGDLDLITINSTGGNGIFINDGTGTFTKYAVGSELLNSLSLNNIGGSFVDYDKNGFLDISTGRNSGNIPPYLYQNTLTASSARNWIEFKLVGTLSNKSAIGARITVTTTSPSRTQIREISARTGYGSQNSLIQHFGLGTATSISQIKITWPNGGQQTWTNPPAGQTMNQVVTIVEDFTGPTFTFTPANGATGVALGNTIQIALNKAGAPVIGKNLTIRTGSATGPLFQIIPITSGTVGANNTYTFTLSSSLTPLTSYFIGIDAGSFVDNFTNTSLAVAPTGWTFTSLDNIPPGGTFTAPVLIDKAAITGSVFSMTATDNISVASVVMSYRGANGGTYQTLNGTLNAGTGKYDFPLQLAFFDALGMEYYFTVTDGSSNNAAVPATGTYVTKLDNVAPAVTFAAPATVPKGGITGQTFNVTATDNFSIASVVMSYRKVTATQYQTLQGTFNAGTSKYDFPLQATFFDDMGMEYYFTATDGTGNTAKSPATGTNITKIAFSATTIALGVVAGTTVNDYKIISIPLDLASSNIANIFADFGAPDPFVWKLLKYQNPQAWLSYPNSFSSAARGEGYFILSTAGQNLKFDGATAPVFSQANLFQMNLVAGFNLIGNPYTMPINWEDSRVAGVNAIKVFQGGNYVDGNTIDVFGGGFVFANAAVTVPVKLKTSANGGRIGGPVISSRIDGQEWIVPITMTQERRQFNFGGVGMSPNASLSYDDLDDLAPPSPMGKFEMDFAHPEHFMKKFSRDVVPTAAGFTWSFTTQSDLNALATLHWDNTGFSSDQSALYLFDAALQRPINMKTESSYTFNPAQSGEFKVYYGTDVKDQLKPNQVFLGQVSPNPAGGLVTIPFTLPDVPGEMNVQLEIVDMLGRTQASLLNKSMTSGFYTVTWDATSSQSGNGLFIVRLAVSSQDSQQVQSTKLIIKK